MLQYVLRHSNIWLGRISKPDYIAVMVKERPKPKNVGAGYVYIVVAGKIQKWALFQCPTGSGEIIQLSLSKKYSPRWKITIDNFGRPSINPSIRQMEGSYAHFIIRNGQVNWCADSGKQYYDYISDADETEV